MKFKVALGVCFLILIFGVIAITYTLSKPSPSACSDAMIRDQRAATRELIGYLDGNRSGFPLERARELVEKAC